MGESIKYIVTGGRNFNNYPALSVVLNWKINERIELENL